MSTLDLYRDLEAKYNSKITELQNKRITLDGELSHAYEAYNQALSSEVDPEQKGNSRMTARAKEAIEKIKAELQDLEERLNVLEHLKRDKLVQLFSSVVKEYSAYQQEVYNKQVEEAQKLKELRCQVLLKAQEIHSMGTEARNLYQDISNMAVKIGAEFRTRYNTPSLPLEFVGGNRAEHLIAMPMEAREALNLGVIPSFVEYYALTGKLLDDDNTARTLLAEIKKGGK